jgi:hypothetical protein
MFSLQHDVFSAMIQEAAAFREEIAAAGGALHVGLYQGEVGTRDFEKRAHELSDGVRRNSFIRTAFPLPSSLYDLLADPDRLLREVNYTPPPPTPNDTALRPKLHLKSQLYASREFVESVLPLPQWHDIVVGILRARAQASQDSRAYFRADTMLVDAQPNSFVALAPLAPALKARTPSERNAQAIYLTLGSQNQDDRSLFGNGEVLAVISSEAALAGLTDYVYLVARATWLDSVEQFNSIQPPVSPIKRRLARWLRRLI